MAGIRWEKLLFRKLWSEGWPEGFSLQSRALTTSSVVAGNSREVAQPCDRAHGTPVPGWAANERSSPMIVSEPLVLMLSRRSPP
jgi:hypothetical protein